MAVLQSSQPAVETFWLDVFAAIMNFKTTIREELEMSPT